MEGSSPQSVTQLLLQWRQGDPAALDQLMPIVYDELRRLARHYISRERTGHTMQTTDLVHEAYLKLIDHTRMQWQDRTHFMAVAAQAMRRILVDHARARHRAKRGGDQLRVTLSQVADIACGQASDLIRLDEALTRLAAIDLRKSRIVELRYFGGLSVEETAEVLDISRTTLMRDWQTAKMWLMREMSK
jgi:RNA polymerase sigma factor (TIGR02999 family)